MQEKDVFSRHVFKGSVTEERNEIVTLLKKGKK